MREQLNQHRALAMILNELVYISNTEPLFCETQLPTIVFNKAKKYASKRLLDGC